MSSQEAAAGSRVLRTRRRNTTKTVAHQAENKSSTKAAKRKTITDSETELVSEKDVLERLGISVGPTTTREKVLDLLGKHVTKKKPRLLSQLVRSRKKSAVKNTTHLPSDDLVRTTVNPPNNQINFEQFNDSQLIDMLKDVGLDTNGFSRIQLLKNCNSYHELITLPLVSQKQFGQPTVYSKLDHHSFDFTPATHNLHPMQGTDSNTPTTQTSAAITPEAGSSVPILPSREHNRLLYPRPHPTILSSTSPEPKSKKDKGKSKARDPTPSISDWNPDDDDTDQSDTDLDLSQAHSRQPSPCDKAKKSGPPPAKNPESEVPQESSAMPESRTPDIENLHLLLMRTNQKVEYLESELKALTKVVHKLSGLLGDGASTPSPSKRRGGRTADRIRFHVDTLLGIKEGSKLPNPTDDTTNVPEDPSTSGTRDETDPCFPYENGPGHKDATPQQLQIMKSMLEAAGLSSFRPDFSKSAASNGNKWIWNVASKIFYKLVECGEYNGVATGGANDTLITKCLDTYARSLSKRYRLQSWEPERLEKSQSRVRQAGRLQKLKKMRDKVVFSKPAQLFKLSVIMENACSDDETDREGTSEGPNRHGLPCLVRNLEWRSEKLSHVCILLDEYTEQRKASIPNSAGKKTGRPSRPRIRQTNAPLSSLPAPYGLPIDCYSSEWLQRVKSEDPLFYGQLDIDQVPVLDEVVLFLEGL